MTVENSLDEGYITLKEAAKLFPGHEEDKPICLQAIYRWSTKGLKGILLQTVQLGSKRCTKQEWIDEFIKKLTEQIGVSRKATPRNNDRQEAVNRELDAIRV